MKMNLCTVRMIDNDQAREYAFGDEKSLKEKLAVGFINPQDFEEIGLVPSLNIKLTTEFGEVVLANKRDETIPKGTILVPISIWANQLTGVKNDELFYKGFAVDVVGTRDKILEFKDLINKIKKE
ncbi:MAG: hypothetical protein EU542_08165 [Promethearchaeota archaeon]|nr:MAG: hypothetical protein EU542_08165 [Candidatus Lokiarchaeota archaeon]